MPNLDLIVRMEFGSTVYGTTVPSSDVDVKGIYVPEATNLVMGTVQNAFNLNTKKNSTEKNTADDKDEEYYSLKKYIDLLLEGQTIAIDMLFVPQKHLLTNHSSKDRLWNVIQENKKSFLHSGYSSFVGYCRTQANKYGIKGSRMNAVKATLEFLASLVTKGGSVHKKLYEFEDDIFIWAKTINNEFVDVVDLLNAQKTNTEPYLQVCNRKVPFHSSLKYAAEMYQKIYNEYGHRARLAQSNEGIDWKALMHAVRIATQAKELLLTHNVVFPRPEKDLLLQIRKGELPYQQVAEMIEEGLKDIEVAARQSTLPKEPDINFAENLVESVYLRKCAEAYGK